MLIVLRIAEPEPAAVQFHFLSAQRTAMMHCGHGLSSSASHEYDDETDGKKREDDYCIYQKRRTV